MESNIWNSKSSGRDITRNRCAFQLLTHYDTLHQPIKSIQLLESIGTKAANKKLVQYQLSLNNPVAAQQALRSVPIVTKEDVNFERYYNFHIQHQSMNRDLFDVTTDEANLLRDIAKDYTRTSFEAQAYLYLLYREEYPLPDIDFSVNPNKTKELTALWQAYPNPSQTDLYFPYELEENATLYIYNSVGNLVQEIEVDAGIGQIPLATQELAKGMYFYYWRMNQKTLHSSKFTVIH